MAFLLLRLEAVAAPSSTPHGFSLGPAHDAHLALEHSPAQQLRLDPPGNNGSQQAAAAYGGGRSIARSSAQRRRWPFPEGNNPDGGAIPLQPSRASAVLLQRRAPAPWQSHGTRHGTRHDTPGIAPTAPGSETIYVDPPRNPAYSWLDDDGARRHGQKGSAAPRVERRIHQSHRDGALGEANAHYASTWRRLYPDWEYFMWTDERLERLVNESYPQLRPLWDGLTPRIKKFDLARALILRQYVDCDFEAWRRLPDATWAADLVLFEDGQWLHEYANSIIASRSHVAFWDRYIARVAAVHAADPRRDVLNHTGPLGVSEVAQQLWGCVKQRPTALGSACELAIRSRALLLVAEAAAFPIAWSDEASKQACAFPRCDGCCLQRFPAAAAAHHWDGSWLKPEVKQRAAALFERNQAARRARAATPAALVAPRDEAGAARYRL